MTGTSPVSLVDRIRRHLVGLKMPRALEVLDHTLRRLECGEIGAPEALLGEELTLREGRRVRAALKMSRLLNIKTLTGFDFSFQPSLNRILTLAQLEFIDRHEVVHFIGQPGCGKTHLALALGVEAVKSGLLRHPGRHRQFARQSGAGGYLARTPALPVPAATADR